MDLEDDGQTTVEVEMEGAGVFFILIYGKELVSSHRRTWYKNGYSVTKIVTVTDLLFRFLTVFAPDPQDYCY